MLSICNLYGRRCKRGRVSSCSAPDVSFPGFSHEDRTVVEIRSAEQPADLIARYPERVIYSGGDV